MDRAARSCIAWRKSSWSNGSSNCVEIAGLRPGIGIRDSKAPAGPVLVLAPERWMAFVEALKAGDHDLT
ncbi:DUF397 domain-containing protein [Actinomadura darangshiensis]|uniref:DUF397 domain-containing protein n=1 Tax=Actinomadura darangshiensis TaxID=705336 RepID=A0A4R5B979_9ACTN|nr:DUF397 domain-containing protein [Actinomadura darangshiensis]TDD80264.1 DUF397 domain-containing protein [Actinomadura darangshiensis]